MSKRKKWHLIYRVPICALGLYAWIMPILIIGGFICLFTWGDKGLEFAFENRISKYVMEPLDRVFL